MRPEEVPDELVEAASQAISQHLHGVPDSYSDYTRAKARHALAAVLPGFAAVVAANTLDVAAGELHARTDGANREGTKGWPERHREVYALAIDEASDALRAAAAEVRETGVA